MKVKPMEPSNELLFDICRNICEEAKYVLDAICEHNRHFPKNKITIDYKKGNNFAEISDLNKDGEVNFIETFNTYSDYKYYIGLIRGYGKGLNAAGIRTTTPKEL